MSALGCALCGCSQAARPIDPFDVGNSCSWQIHAFRPPVIAGTFLLQTMPNYKLETSSLHCSDLTRLSRGSATFQQYQQSLERDSMGPFMAASTESNEEILLCVFSKNIPKDKSPPECMRTCEAESTRRMQLLPEEELGEFGLNVVFLTSQHLAFSKV